MSFISSVLQTVFLPSSLQYVLLKVYGRDLHAYTKFYVCVRQALLLQSTFPSRKLDRRVFLVVVHSNSSGCLAGEVSAEMYIFYVSVHDCDDVPGSTSDKLRYRFVIYFTRGLWHG